MELPVLTRKLTLKDDLTQVGRLIYLTDPYIFPYLFDSDIDAAARVFAEMVKGDTIYNVENITAAFVGDTVAGILVSSATPLVVSSSEMMDAYMRAGEIVDEKFAKVFREYYALLENEPDGIYIANVSVDPKFRRRGVADALLTAVLRQGELYRLETVKANGAAYGLYEKHGFVVECEYPGFTDVPCLRMVRPAYNEGFLITEGRDNGRFYQL